MPRKRMVDPGIWRSEQFNELSHSARLLFIGLFSNADDDGRLHGSAKYLKANVFPFDDITAADVDAWRDEILQRELVILYEYEGREYIALPTWPRYQRIDRPSPSHLPAPEDSSSVRRGFVERSSLIEENRIEESIREEKGETDGAPRLIFDHWNTKDIIKHRRLTQAIRSAIKTRLRDFSQDEIVTAIDTYAEILQSSEHYWSHSWTLLDFLKPRNIERFMEPIKAKEVYRHYETHRGNGRKDRVSDADQYESPDEIYGRSQSAT